MTPFLDLKAINARYRDELQDAFARVLDSGIYIQGPELQKFESAFAIYCHAEHCIGVSNGLDALTLVLRAWLELGYIGSDAEVLVPSNTFIATALAVTHAGLRIRWVEPDPDTHVISPLAVEQSLTDATKVIVPVHLYGQMADMTALRQIAQKHQLLILEDAAQAHGAKRDGLVAGSAGDAAGFSFYPGKNLGALGDAGAITTNDHKLAEAVRRLVNYGSRQKYVHEIAGYNQRLDPLQAAFLSIKLAYLNDDNQRRKDIAERYLTQINNPAIHLPSVVPSSEHVWHLFVIRTAYRNELQSYLNDCGIATLIHYPTAPHQQAAYRHLGAPTQPIAERLQHEVLSLPISPVMTDDDVAQVVHYCNQFMNDTRT